ncbi:DUF2087 domain-containing protein [Aquibacillus kalidii]|uniref:DUF2087 domain-containing protein n=1 Tax=Aquibacillus kalidii TaxID=2762597 RepID=UPI00164523D9|nr:DUF2087 domain-containing protein [Aquibacillus kalidii]
MDFGTVTVEELKSGFIFKEKDSTYSCLICNESYQQGIIYPGENGVLYDAQYAIRQHIQSKHDSMFHYLVGMDKKYTGLSDIQKQILLHFKDGLTDKEIAKQVDAGSTSTIRTHRFKLKEKEKQAKVLLAIMDLLANDTVEDELVKVHKGAKMVDERYAITEQEKLKVLTNYFKKGLDVPLDAFPSKAKRKIVVLQNIITKFNRERKYSEAEVNQILKEVFGDFVTLRRSLIEYGFMDRSNDGSEYWVKG